MLIAYVMQFGVTTAFSHLWWTVVTPSLIVCDLCNKEQKKALTKKKQWRLTNALMFLKFHVAWTLPAYAHAQNCPSRLIMHHLFSLDPIVDLFTDMPSSQSFLLYVLQPTVVDKQQICRGRGRDNRRKLMRLSRLYTFLNLLRVCCLSAIIAKQHFVTDCLKIT